MAKKYDLMVIEDAAHATGATYKGKKIGSHSSLVCFSFHPVKNLAMPNGGVIALNNEKHRMFRKKLESRRWCGITNRKNFTYDIEEIGNNYQTMKVLYLMGMII